MVERTLFLFPRIVWIVIGLKLWNCLKNVNFR